MRVKWLSANIDYELLAKLKDKMLELDFDEEDFDGFRLDRSLEYVLSGRYIVRRSETSTNLDPFGREYTYEYIAFDVYTFMLRTEFPQLILIDSPRAVNPLLHRLAAISGYLLEISEITVNLQEWLQVLNNAYGKIKVVKIATKNISLSNTVAGKILLAGTEDVRPHMAAFTVSETPLLEKVKVILENESIQIEMSSSGLCLVKGDASSHDQMVDVVADTLKQQPSNTSCAESV